ncbi:protein piwi [Teleopsis dalmanni]|uniref:protein piwi n=1 Tax=Teleopsis dalmanni TaxID=139649 RepID=UPI0018CF27AA|nr:protein piwi [Teleopsis dalmanni]XP_037958069.1 protein piwi [Teleopsis dalmanni]XP_037958070.1 protein piwi [Teleopsis dalmanni]XP_037958071.1 protein piwi [Teleopsis dalmanni]
MSDDRYREHRRTSEEDPYDETNSRGRRLPGRYLGEDSGSDRRPREPDSRYDREVGGSRRPRESDSHYAAGQPYDMYATGGSGDSRDSRESRRPREPHNPFDIDRRPREPESRYQDSSASRRAREPDSRQGDNRSDSSSGNNRRPREPDYRQGESLSGGGRRPREPDLSYEEPRSKQAKRDDYSADSLKKERRSAEDDVATTSQGSAKCKPVKLDSEGKSKGIDDAREITKGDGKPKVEREERGNRRTRLRFDAVNTRPKELDSKLGSSGRTIRLQTNYFVCDTKADWCIYQHIVYIDPEIEVRRIRSGVLSIISSVLGGYLYDGLHLFSNKKITENETKYEVDAKDERKYTITIRYVGVLQMTEYQALHILNLILRRAMGTLNLQLVGRNFYDALAKINIKEFNLQLWPGYETAIRQHERGILLRAEIAHKAMRTETLYDILRRCMSNNKNYQEEFRRQVIGTTVLTDYNNQTYTVNDIDFNLTPKGTFLYKDAEITFIEYYSRKYNIHIRDERQPLLLTKGKKNLSKTNEIITLIPELCRATGLNEEMRSNFNLMRTLAEYTRMNPDRRIDRLMAFNRRLKSSQNCSKIFNEWNLKLGDSLVEVTGRVLEPQKIVFSNQKVPAGDDADWNRHFRSSHMLTSPSRGLDRWAFVYMGRQSRDMRNFTEALLRAANGLKFQISRPREMAIGDDRTYSYISALEEAARGDPQLIMCLVPNNNAERYITLKKKCCLDRAIPMQVITQKVAGNQRGLMSIATKVAIQINAKLGYTPWMVEIPLSGLMIVGFDAVKSTRDRSKKFGALVATMDMKINSTFYSTVAEMSAHDNSAPILWTMMVKALHQYRLEHQALPKRIIFYRDGVSDGQLEQVVDFEVKELVARLNEQYKAVGSDKGLMFSFIVVTKTSNTRFFAQGKNPPPGTVVDDVVTMPERYDFYIVSQCVRQGTVSPTAYNVIFSNIRLSPDQIQLLTYKACHLYYNWSGTTRVPAVCQYAKKLATLVSHCLLSTPHCVLEKRLYYL